MHYNSRFIDAVHRTKRLNLRVSEQILPLTKGISKRKKDQVYQLSIDYLKQKGLMTSSLVAGRCVEVHTSLKPLLKKYLNLDSSITIGDRVYDDYIYCEMSEKSIQKELAFPQLDKSIKVHVWLTLSDGTILDCTGESHADLIFGRGEHPIEQSILISHHGNLEKLSSGYFRPWLVGSDFLKKTGSLGTKYR
ncbi:TPA: hypothetical protein N2785_004471 [Vibrio parahaemolyticus]|nr:hypothetical protein [Vibrio parahaemolyticus]